MRVRSKKKVGKKLEKTLQVPAQSKNSKMGVSTNQTKVSKKLTPKVKKNELGKGSGIKIKTVEQAIEGVRHLEKQRDVKKSSKDLLEDDSDERNIFLQVSMVKVANLLPRATSVVRPVKLKVFLPNTVVNSNTDVLLIAKDSEDGRDIRDDHTENLYFHQRKLKLCGASRHISEVITLRQLKVEFKEYEAKRNLANRTDVVLCDDTIVRRIPMFLGKHFYEKRKFPIPVDLKAKNLLSEVERCLSLQILYLPMKGNSGLMKIGCMSQSNKMIVENIQAAVKKMMKQFPGGWDNVQALYLKTGKSKSVPFYAKLKPLNDIQSIEPKNLSNKTPVTDEVTTEFGDLYTVFPDNNVVFLRKYNEYRSLNAQRRREMLSEKRLEEKASKMPKKGKTKNKKMDVLKDDTDIAEPTAKKTKTDAAEPAAKKKMSSVVSSDDKAAKKKGSKQDKKSKKKRLDDLDLDVEEEKRISRMEVEYLKKLKMGVETEVKEAVSDEEYDDWAEGSDEDLGDGDEDFEF